MGVVPPASAGSAYLLSLFFFRIDVKNKSMGGEGSNQPIWIPCSCEPPAHKNSGFASL
ncbi:hypothetical protein PRJ_4625 [Pseudomonas sp. XWY-1]|jgi:hypothetical protein|nr:hypothetical protein PRJ_4625 [Pseudomonas sp. XWY-1]